MKFSTLEKIMYENGARNLAEIARKLKTTPQAVSNWKARGQVPFHVVAEINKYTFKKTNQTTVDYSSSYQNSGQTINLSDVLLILARQIKVIFLIPLISIFLTTTYVLFIQSPQYISWATIIVPSNAPNTGGLSAIANQFGVNIPSGVQADLSSPSLFPEILKSRTFAERILEKKFSLNNFDKQLTLLEILADKPNGKFSKDELVTIALPSLMNMIKYENKSIAGASKITVTTNSPLLSKDLAASVISELELLNRQFKSRISLEKTKFIEDRISAVVKDLKQSEIKLKNFNEQNRQISSPSLQLEQDRLSRDLDVQKGVYLTLKQQIELAKIEVIQQGSIIQILDYPHIALGPSNKNLFLNVILSGLFGLAIGIFLAFFRSYIIENEEMNERKKLRKVKNFVKKKSKDIFFDERIYGIVSTTMFLCAPFI